MSVLADFSRTCPGRNHVRTEQIPKLDTLYRCFAEGPRKGRGVSDRGRSLPYVPAWRPEKMKGRKNYGTKKNVPRRL